jgi:hypothetical protein
MYRKFWFGNLNRRDHVIDLAVDGRMSERIPMWGLE